MIFMLTPYIPGLRNIPKATGIYKLMRSESYESSER